MKIVNDNELIHIDSSLDVIEHYGKKGMKWGVRNPKLKEAKADLRYRNKLARKQRRETLRNDKSYRIARAVNGANALAALGLRVYNHRKTGTYDLTPNQRKVIRGLDMGSGAFAAYRKHKANKVYRSAKKENRKIYKEAKARIKYENSK